MKKLLFVILCSLWLGLDVGAQCVLRYTKAVREIPATTVNGKEFILRKTIFVPSTAPSDSSHVIWRLREPEFDTHFGKFTARYPGLLNRGEEETLADWKDNIWNNIVPRAIKDLVKDYCSRNSSWPSGIFDIFLFVDKTGRIFTVEFHTIDEIYRKLNDLPENTMGKLYGNLLKERCGIVEKVGISCDENNKLNDVFDDDERGQGDEYTVVSLHGVAFAVWGTSNTLKILRDASSETGGMSGRSTNTTKRP